MPHDHLVRKQALLDYKNGFYVVTRLGYFWRGYPMILVKKLKFYILFVSGQNGPRNNVLMIIEAENKPS